MALSTQTVLPTKARRSSSLGSIFLFLLFVGALAFVAFNRNIIHDWLVLRNYAPPATVSSLADQTTMTSKGRNLLYINKPQLETKTNFKNCNLGTEQAAVLGCYHGGQAGIFILDVTDSRLNGIEQVTAAHEMLHAAYERLNSRQKQSLNVMLQDYYDHGLHDQTILDQMAGYKKSEPNDVVDEMHSVFGTEVMNLPSGLEQYYKQYFTDRSTVAKFYNTYQAEFTSRQAAVKDYDAKLATTKNQIDNIKSMLQSQNGQLQAQQTQLNSYRSSGNISAYNAGVPGYNALVNDYNSSVGELRSAINAYNQLVSARNAVVVESQQLTNEISSQVQPIGQ